MRHWSIATVILMCAMFVAGLTSAAGPANEAQFPEVRPGSAFHFPADHGAHPAFRNEWWYITGWLKRPNGSPIGFQVTFFRFRPGIAEDNPSAFAPKQILFAHAAISDPAVGKLLHEERFYREGFGLAEAATQDARVVIGDWSLSRSVDGKFHTIVHGKSFSLSLSFDPAQPVLLEGDKGYSRKSPRPGDASYYYSIPHLAVSGTIERNGNNESVTGSAWLDREWSSNYLNPKATGWDWIGLNLDDGGALMAFRIRGSNGENIWAGGTLRTSDGTVHVFAPEDLRFTPARRWHSTQTGTDYPVETVVSVRLPDGQREWHLTPLFDNQEYDSRGTGGPVYWEGAVRAAGASGYLEMTGYYRPLRL
jgi:predicted secreted hydrolase